MPAYTLRSLTAWYNHRTRLHCWRVVQHYTQRVTGQLAMLDQLDIIGKTSEFARVFGIEFYDVLSRGSQVLWWWWWFYFCFFSLRFFLCVCVCCIEVFFVCVCCIVLWRSFPLPEQTCLEHKAFKNVFALKVPDIDSPPLFFVCFLVFFCHHCEVR